MLQLKNTTPFAAAIALFPNEQGVDTLYTITKATFQIGKHWTLLEEQAEPCKEDIYWGEPGLSSLRQASDYHTGKSGTDLVVIGSAYAPQEALVSQLDVSVQLGAYGKAIRVFGNRVWDRGRVSSAEPFTSMPLVYERAFGGVDVADGQLRAAELRNPVGMGFAGKKSYAEVNGSYLPNLECPRKLIQDYRDTPPPACFAPIAPNWQPRISYAGTYDDYWKQHRAPFLPEDYRPRFMNVAHPDLVCTEFLKGGEPVRITGMHPNGDLAFNLPSVNLLSKAQVAGREVCAAFDLETVLIDTLFMRLTILWRSAITCNKQALKIREVNVSMVR